MGLARIFGICAAFLFAASVGAAEIIDLGPSDYRRWGTGTNTHTMDGLRSSTGQTVRMPPLNTSLNVNRNAVIPYNSLANGMRNFVRINPGSVAASAAVAGLFLAVDWVFDNATGEWRKEGTEVAPIEDNSQFGWGCASCDGNRFSEPTETCQWIAANVNFGGVRTLQSTQRVSATRYNCVLERSDGSTHIVFTSRTGDNCPAGFDYNDANARCERGQLIELDASDWSELAGYLPSANPQQVGTAGHDTQRLIGNPLPGFSDVAITGPSSVSGPTQTSTSTDPATGSTTVTETSTQTNITYGDTTITTTNTTTTNTYVDGQHTQTETTTETPGELPVTQPGISGTEWPGFCDWAVRVCEWLDWTQEDPGLEDPDLPVPIDEDYFEQKNISFGAKSCPPDYEIHLSSFLSTSVGVSFQPLCDFAGIIYYMVMAASYIIAAYISIGVARNG